MKKLFFMLAIVFISGLISADICHDLIEDSKILLNLEIYKSYAHANLVYRDVFWNILYERVKLIAFIILLYFTPIRNFLSNIVVILFSYMWGFYIMSCILELGMAGIIVGIFSVIPHGILYGILIIMILLKGEGYTYYQNKQIVLNVANVIIMILLLLTGCVLESLISTHFIPWVIRLSLI